jgi:hypothetical protein
MQLFAYILSQSVHCSYLQSLLIVHSATLLKVFMMSRWFLVRFFRSFRYKIISSANRDSLAFSFPI